MLWNKFMSGPKFSEQAEVFVQQYIDAAAEMLAE
jgi:hypothetical protein